jgi:hypothetical protein
LLRGSVPVQHAPPRAFRAIGGPPGDTSMKTAAIVLGLLFLAVAIAYFVIPASSLPSFFPGFEAGSARVHVKHGLASLVVAVVLFVIAWYAGRSAR